MLFKYEKRNIFLGQPQTPCHTLNSLAFLPPSCSINNEQTGVFFAYVLIVVHFLCHVQPEPVLKLSMLSRSLGNIPKGNVKGENKIKLIV